MTISKGVKKPIEQRDRIMWSRCRLRMVLDREDRQRAVSQAFDRAIVEVDVRDRKVWRAFDAFRRANDGKAVVL